MSAVRRALGCQAVFADAAASRALTRAALRDVARRASACAASGQGDCGLRGDAGCRATCAALADCLALAVEPGVVRRALRGDWLDALIEPAWVCDGDLTVLHANARARRAWDDGAPGVDDDGRLAVGAAERAMRQAIDRVQARREHVVVFELASGERLAVSRLRDADGIGDALLIRLLGSGLSHLRTVPARQLAARLAPLRLTPRQEQLAVHLLHGASLSAAAVAMGICRATANEHLAALFRRSGTHRQGELLEWLARRLAP
ncbi:MAG: hypothetical protein KDH20_13910 [Rhodocyclaceae bacterium]|nr:hypothetical protein [Rhodocyclaceae bacterium]